jgi:hypothetical protein
MTMPAQNPYNETFQAALTREHVAQEDARTSQVVVAVMLAAGIQEMVVTEKNKLDASEHRLVLRDLGDGAVKIEVRPR